MQRDGRVYLLHHHQPLGAQGLVHRGHHDVREARLERSVAWHRVAQHGMARHGMGWHGMGRHANGIVQSRGLQTSLEQDSIKYKV